MNTRFRCVIVDDEQNAVQTLSHLIKKHPSLTVIKSYTNPVQAFNELTEHDKIDFMFLNIEMPELSGFDFAKKTRSKARHLIFTSTYTRYALKAFEYGASQYLIKPLNEPKLLKALDPFICRLNEESGRIKVDDSLFIQIAEDRFTRIEKADIIMIQAENNTIIIFTLKATFITQVNMEHAAMEFGKDSRFLVVNPSFIIKLDAVLEVTENIIRLKDNLTAPFSNNYKNLLEKP